MARKHEQLDLSQAVAIETMIDGFGLVAVLSAIQDICDAKADHVRTHWQDSTLARDWEYASIQIANIADRLYNRNKTQFSRTV